MDTIVTVLGGRAVFARVVSFAAALCVAVSTFPSAEAAVYSENAVKAAFLHRFAAYVEWPPAAAQAAPFTIGVLEADGVVEELEHLLPGLIIQNRTAQVRKVARAEELEGVHILYIGARQLTRAKPLIAAASARPILVVTDEAGGLERGATINFVPVGRNLRLEVSLTAAERSGLKINSGLLSVAVRVVRRPQADSVRGGNGSALANLGRGDKQLAGDAQRCWYFRRGAVRS